jgi:hypothetical protein
VSVRHKVPQPLHTVAQRAYVGAGELTSAARLPPDFIVVGASRSGTTSLFRALSAHPDVLRPAVNKGVRYFDLNYGRPWRWYLGHFPLRMTASRRGAHVRRALCFEASGYYLFHPFTAERIARHLPDVRIVAMLRDPVERAFSGWKHESARGFEWEPFERALELEGDRLLGEVDRMALDVTYRSFCHWHHSHRSRGEYADQLRRLLAVIPRERVHVIPSEAFFAQPEREYRALLGFLGLPAHEPASFERHNARPSAAMPASIRRALAHHYADGNQELESLVGRPLDWT